VIIVTLRNLKTNKIFTKKFTSEYLARKFILKCRHSEKVEIIKIIKEDF